MRLPCRFIYIPFLFWMFWQEEERVEVRGHDTRVPAPICLCKPCQETLRAQPSSMKTGIGMAILFIAFGGLAGYYIVAVGVGLALTGLLGTGLWMFTRSYLSSRARQSTFKDLLRRVPVYRQMLASYPDAIVVVPLTDQMPAGKQAQLPEVD